jgi:hypothetical protein
MGRPPTPSRARLSARGAADSRTDSRLRYGGPWFSAASTLPLDAGLTRPWRLANLIAVAVCRPRRLLALIALLMRTPRLYVAISGSPTGQALDRYFAQRWLGIPKNRLCRGVLLLPENHADYLRGPRRHTLRTNLRKAATSGIRCETLGDSRHAGDAVSAVLRHRDGLPEAELDARTNYFQAWVARQDMTVMVARDRDDTAVAVLAAAIDNSVCAIGFAIAASHQARWALHDHLVGVLIARRVRCLLSADEGPFGALGYSPNVQYYQHLLGYELRHVIPITPSRPAWRRRRLALAAAMLMGATALVAPSVAESKTVGAPPAVVARPRSAKSPRLNGTTATRPEWLLRSDAAPDRR